MELKSAPPKSCANWWINLVGLGFLFMGVWVLTTVRHQQPLVESVYFLLSFVLLPILVLEFFFLRPDILRNIRQPSILSRASPKRVVIKLSALYVVYLTLAFVYWLLPEYAGSFYAPFWNYVLPAVPWLVVLAIPYFWLVDCLQEEPEDEYYALGKFLFRIPEYDKERIGQLALGWAVKGFFLPLMIVYLGGNLLDITSGKYTLESITASFGTFYDWSWKLLLVVDLAFVSMGYSVTLKLIGSNIRSTEPTMLGWTVALICYEPFSSTIFSLYTEYNLDNFGWGEWLADAPLGYKIWGSLILMLMWIYALASVSFGHRFSNLTHRGIITNGPFRFSKHPAYISKNISWWMISIPFIAINSDFLLAFKQCCLLLLVNFIYFMRARTEERHLSRDPIYREYTAWIAEYGLIARIKKRYILTYRFLQS
ncbi:MAG: protein-S-isoprenylcysteine O-methyltransferase Ste14 [Parasphingorhabdus sp.]|jgi:protein-S-isoprenylcysteine O-methyltransferase Ste14